MGIRKHGKRVYFDVSSLKTASLKESGLTEQEQREAEFIAAVDGSGLGVVLKDSTGPTGIIMPILEHPLESANRSAANEAARATIRMPSSYLKITRGGGQS